MILYFPSKVKPFFIVTYIFVKNANFSLFYRVRYVFFYNLKC